MLNYAGEGNVYFEMVDEGDALSVKTSRNIAKVRPVLLLLRLLLLRGLSTPCSRPPLHGAGLLLKLAPFQRPDLV